MSLRLHGAAHDAEAHDRRAVPGDEAGNDRLVGALFRPDAVRMPRLQHERRAAVLQRHAVDDHAGAEPHEVRLDERHHHAARVCRGEIDRTALGRHAVAEVLRALHVDELRARFQVLGLQQGSGRHIDHVVDVGHVAPRVCKGELDRFDLEVEAVRPIDRERAHVEMLQDAERDQRHDALPIRRDLVQGIAAIVHLERRHPVGLVGGEIGGAHRGFVLLRVRFDLLRDRPTVERLSLRARDVLQHVGMGRPAEALARPRRAAVRHEGLGEPGLVLQLGHLLVPLAGDGGRDEKSFPVRTGSPARKAARRAACRTSRASRSTPTRSRAR